MVLCWGCCGVAALDLFYGNFPSLDEMSVSLVWRARRGAGLRDLFTNPPSWSGGDRSGAGVRAQGPLQGPEIDPPRPLGPGSISMIFAIDQNGGAASGGALAVHGSGGRGGANEAGAGKFDL